MGCKKKKQKKPKHYLNEYFMIENEPGLSGAPPADLGSSAPKVTSTLASWFRAEVRKVCILDPVSRWTGAWLRKQ